MRFICFESGRAGKSGGLLLTVNFFRQDSIMIDDSDRFFLYSHLRFEGVMVHRAKSKALPLFSVFLILLWYPIDTELVLRPPHPFILSDISNRKYGGRRGVVELSTFFPATSSDQINRITARITPDGD